MSDYSSKISIAIAGGGVGGLSLAAGLQKCPYLDVQVYEGTKAYTDIGAGLSIHGNGIRAMGLLGEEVKRAYFESAELSTKDEEEELATEVLVGMGENAHKVLVYLGAAKGRKTVARADLLKGFAKLIQSDRLHFGKRLVRVEEQKDKKVILHFEDGSEAAADCLIGADGVHSRTRNYLLGEDHPAAAPKDQGWVLFRRMVPMEEARKSVDERLLHKVPIYCGPGSAINCMPIHGGRTYAVSVTYLKTAARSKSEGDEHLVLRKDFFKDWIPEARNAVELLNQDPGEPWVLEDHDPAPYYYRGRVAMIGDAAHAITPFAGNGASQALEDASTMLALFKDVRYTSQIPKAFEAFDAIRRPRSQKVVELSRMFGRLYAFMDEEVGDDLNKIRKRMKESAAIMSDIDLQEQNQEALRYFKQLV